jgi:hypothetical protein
MFNLSAKTLLAFVIFACPLGCQAESCCADDVSFEQEAGGSAACHSCCPNGECEESAQHPNPPAPPEQPCQCLCGGAVISPGGIDLKLKCDQWTGIVAISTATMAGELICHEAGTVRCYHSDATPGRVIRGLHMSFLC